MLQPGRKYEAESGYRYGFNGKEMDHEVKGKGNSQDYGMRIYDPRLGRFLSVDPLNGSYPWYSSYQFAGNSPIQAIDLDGAEEYHYLRFKDKDGKTVLALLKVTDIEDTRVTKWGKGRGGLYALATKVVKNERQIYIVKQESEYAYDDGAYVYDYVEDNVYKTLGEAQAASDENFALTDDDFYQKIAGGVAYYTDGMTDLPSVDWNTTDYQKSQTGRSRPRGSKGKNGLKSAPKGIEYHLHHLISKGLGKTSAFVKKAMAGGFKLNGMMNLTPLERFIKKYGTGVHAKHTKYTAQIKDFLEGLDINKFTEQKANSLMQKLNDHLIQKIKENPNIKINDLDLGLKNFKYD